MMGKDLAPSFQSFVLSLGFSSRSLCLKRSIASFVVYLLLILVRDKFKY